MAGFFGSPWGQMASRTLAPGPSPMMAQQPNTVFGRPGMPLSQFPNSGVLPATASPGSLGSITGLARAIQAPPVGGFAGSPWGQMMARSLPPAASMIGGAPPTPGTFAGMPMLPSPGLGGAPAVASGPARAAVPMMGRGPGR